MRRRDHDPLLRRGDHDRDGGDEVVAEQRRCDDHRADWPFRLRMVVGEFRAENGDGPADLREALETLTPRIESRLPGRRRRRELLFALSLFIDPMFA